MNFTLTDAWIWMGWNIQKIPCGFSIHVVACKFGSSFSLQVLDRNCRVRMKEPFDKHFVFSQKSLFLYILIVKFLTLLENTLLIFKVWSTFGRCLWQLYNKAMKLMHGSNVSRLLRFRNIKPKNKMIIEGVEIVSTRLIIILFLSEILCFCIISLVSFWAFLKTYFYSK